MSGGGVVVTLRDEVRGSDAARVRAIIEGSGFFSAAEVGVAVELVEERLSKGVASGYHFLFAEDEGGDVLGYACFGEIPCTVGSYDLYWIAVDPSKQRGGVGRMLLGAAEGVTAGWGGRRVYIETSSRELYLPTRGFYVACGYAEEAVLKDFYGVGDDKVIYGKGLGGAGASDGA